MQSNMLSQYDKKIKPFLSLFTKFYAFDLKTASKKRPEGRFLMLFSD